MRKFESEKFNNQLNKPNNEKRQNLDTRLESNRNPCTHRSGHGDGNANPFIDESLNPLIVSKMLTVNEIAEQLGCAPKTIRKWIKDGSLAGVKLPGGDWRMKIEHLENWVNLRTVKKKAI